jgi:DNA-binding transcriptional ArsR family regulator
MYRLAMTLVAEQDVLERVGVALADPTRRWILMRLLEGPAYPAQVAGELGVSRALVSNHLACLRGCGLVRATREGRQMRYELSDARLAEALRQLARVVLDSDACPAHLAPPAVADDGRRSALLAGLDGLEA